jgi:VanZ family protein
LKARFWFATFWTVGIMVSCFLPAKMLPPSPAVSFDKFIHFGMFFVFALAWCGCRPSSKRIALVAILGALYAVGVEILQGALPGERTANLVDAMANLTGLATGFGAAYLCKVVRRTP